MSDFEKLIPELGEWKTNVGTWLHAVGRFDHAIGYGQLFWPNFKIHDDCVLFADCRADQFETWMNHLGGNRTAVEGMLNHRHILDLFTQTGQAPPEEAVVYLGRLLRDMWSSTLARSFPDRVILVSFDDSPKGDLIDYQITFYQDR